MSWSSVALYTLTGTLTSPKEIEPFQMERIESVCPYGHADTRLTTMRQLSAGYMPRFDTSGPLHFDRPAGLAVEVSADKIERITGDLNDVALAVRLHAVGRTVSVRPTQA